MKENKPTELQRKEEYKTEELETIKPIKWDGGENTHFERTDRFGHTSMVRR